MKTKFVILSFLILSTHKTDHHDITEILLKVALNTIILTLYFSNIVAILASPLPTLTFRGKFLLYLMDHLRYVVRMNKMILWRQSLLFCPFSFCHCIVYLLITISQCQNNSKIQWENRGNWLEKKKSILLTHKYMAAHFPGLVQAGQ
jgi:cytochrome bd-type quinol oxidase subunit 2